MADKQIVIKDYFNILRDDYGRIYCIQEIGDPKSLIKAIREQNEYIQAKEQECEELKKELISFMNGDYCANDCSLRQQLNQLKAENDLYKNAHKTEQDRRRSYENALAEIKEIAKQFCNACQEFEPENRKCMYCNYGKILQKISECEVENE